MSTIKVTNIKAADGISALTIADGTGVVGANKFTDLAGTGAPDFPNGLVLSSNATGGDISGVTLDDYEEGTFATTISGAADVTVNDTGRTHYYTKIGNLVHCKLYFNITGSSSGTPRFTFTVPFSMTATQININGFGYPYALLWWGTASSTNGFTIRSTTTSASAHDLFINFIYSTS
jgi:hypothetical protein